MKTHGAIPYSRAEIEARFDDSEHWKRILAGLEAHEALQASYENLNTVRGVLSERMLAYVSKADQAETALQELKTVLNDALEASYFEDEESDWKERAKTLLSATPASDHVVAVLTTPTSQDPVKLAAQVETLKTALEAESAGNEMGKFHRKEQREELERLKAALQCSSGGQHWCSRCDREVEP